MVRARRVIGYLVILACVFTMSCKDKEKEEALLQAEQARLELVKVKAALSRANRELTDVKEELVAVKETRNELQARVDQMTKEHGSVVAEAGNALERIKQLTAQSNDQAKNVSTLQSEIARYKTLTETQQATIEELQKTIEQLQGNTEEEQEMIEPSEEQPSTSTR